MNKICCKCKEGFNYEPEDTYLDYSGFGYTTKLVKCKYCHSVNILEFIEDITLDVNNNERYYQYD